MDIEKPDGAVVQFGGQTAIKLTEALMKMGVPILRHGSGGCGRGGGPGIASTRFWNSAGSQGRRATRCSLRRRPKQAAADAGLSGAGAPVLRAGRPGHADLQSMTEDVDEFIGIINQIAQDHPDSGGQSTSWARRSRWTRSATAPIS